MIVLAHGVAVLAQLAGPLGLGWLLARRAPSTVRPGPLATGLVAGLFAAAGVVLLGQASAGLFATGMLPAPAPGRAPLVGAVLRALAVVLAEGFARRWAFRRLGEGSRPHLLGLGFGAANAALAGLFALAVMALALGLREGTQGDLTSLGFDATVAPRIALKLDAWWNVAPAAPLLSAGQGLLRVLFEVGLAAMAGRCLASGRAPWLRVAALQLPFALAEELAHVLAPSLAAGEALRMATYGALGLAGVWMARSASGRSAR